MSEPNTYAIINNPLLQKSDVVAQAVPVIQQTLATLGSYTPTEVNTFLDWSYDAGDIVTVEKDGESYQLPIFTSNLTWNGAHDIQWASSGNETRELPNVQERKSYGQGAGFAGAIQKVDDVEYEFHTYVEQTDEYIHLIATETDVQAARDVGQSLLSITASEIAAVVAQTGVNSTLERFDKTKPYAIGDQVAYNGVWYEFTSAHTAGDDWNANEVKQIKTMQTIVTEAAGEVASYVEKTGIDQLGQDETLWSLIQQQAGRIDLVVSGSGSEASIRIGQIVDGINTNAVAINAEKITIGNGKDLGDLITVSGGDVYVQGDLSTWDDVSTRVLTVGGDGSPADVSFNGGYFQCGSNAGFGGTVGFNDNVTFGSYTLATTDFPNVIKDASVTGNVLTLTKLNGDQISINFSGATLVSGAWSGNRYIVTATSGTVVATGIVYNHLVPTGSVRKSDKMVYRDVIVYSDDGSGEAADILFTDSVGINASEVFDDGVKSVSLVKGQWNGGILSVLPNVGTATPVTVQLSQGQGEWIDENGTKRYAFPIMDGMGSTGYTCKINTPTVSSVTAGNDPQRTGDSWFDIMTVTLSNGYTGTATVDVSDIYNHASADVDVVKGNWTSGSILFSPSTGGGSSQGLELDTGEITYTSNGAIQIISIEDSTVTGDNKATGFSVYNTYPKASTVTMGTPTQSDDKWVADATLFYNTSQYEQTIRNVDVTDVFTAGMAEGSEDTTLTGGWENGTYTVKATPQGDEISTSPVLDFSDWTEGKKSVTLKDNGDSTGISDEIVIPPIASIDGRELNAGYFAITCTIGGTTRSGNCFIDTSKSREAGADDVVVESLIKNGDATFSSNYKTVYIPAKATASNGQYKEASINCKIDTAYEYAYGKGWEAALGTVVLDPDSNITISSERTVTVQAYRTPDATSRTTLKSVKITPSGGGGGGGGGGGSEVLVKVPIKTNGEWTVINTAYSAALYGYGWMPVEYKGTTGFMMAKFIYGTKAYYGNDVPDKCQGGITSIPSGMQFNMTATIRASSGSTVNLRSKPST